MSQYSVDVLDHLTAPKLSCLTTCGAVEIPALPDFDTALKMNQVLGGVRYKNRKAEVLIMTFISRLKTAVSEYNQGRQFLEKYVDALPGNHLLEAHRNALAHFENSILQLHVAIAALAALGGGKVKPWRPQSDYDRLRVLNNHIKHFDEKIEDAMKSAASVPIVPVWITNDGFECAETSLLFLEMEAIFEAQAKDAEAFSNPAHFT
jgi:hypothetical protein